MKSSTGANLSKEWVKLTKNRFTSKLTAFLGIGHTPNSDIFKPWIETDEIGYIQTKPNACNQCAGVFAAGDVADSTTDKLLRQPEADARLPLKQKDICRIV